MVAERSSGKTMTREEFDRIARMQDEYLRDTDVVVIDGYIGNDPAFRTQARLTIEKANANIAGMQQKLYFPREDRRRAGGAGDLHAEPRGRRATRTTA